MKKINTPYLIGGICLVIAALLYFQGRAFISVALAGFILLFTRKKYNQQLFDLFVDSFRQWKTIVTTALAAALYWLFLFLSFYFYNWQLQLKAASAQASTVLDKSAMIANPSLISQNITEVRALLALIIIGGIVLVFFNLITYTLSRGFIWTSIAHKKLTKPFLKKFFLLNLFWWLIWIPLAILLALANKQAAQANIVFLLFLAYFFTPILHTLFISGRKIGDSISNAFAIGISRLFRFIVPYTYAFVLYLILYQLFRFVQTSGSKTVFAVSLLFVVLYISWLRTYLYGVIKKLI